MKITIIFCLVFSVICSIGACNAAEQVDMMYKVKPEKILSWDVGKEKTKTITITPDINGFYVAFPKGTLVSDGFEDVEPSFTVFDTRLNKWNGEVKPKLIAKPGAFGTVIIQNLDKETFTIIIEIVTPAYQTFGTIKYFPCLIKRAAP